MWTPLVFRIFTVLLSHSVFARFVSTSFTDVHAGGFADYVDAYAAYGVRQLVSTRHFADANTHGRSVNADVTADVGVRPPFPTNNTRPILAGQR